MKKSYVCPMHPEVTSEKPGKCSKCGMDLVPMETDHGEHGHHEHSGHDMAMGHDHASMMSMPGVAESFLKRFFIVTFLLVPLFIFSTPGRNILGYGDFAARKFVEFGIATVVFYFGLVFFEHAKHEIKARQYGMMTLVSLAVGAGYLFSAAGTFIPAIAAEFYLEISTLIWVLLFGHFLEAKSSSAAGNALQEVAKLLPKSALRLRSGSSDQYDKVGVEVLKKGDIVRVLPGEKVPADGEIVKGAGSFNEAHISGESKPIEKMKGDMVVAGSICMDSSVDVKLSRVGENSTVGQIKKLVSEAQQTKPSAQKLADRAAKWLTFSALSVAILALVVWSVVIGQTFVFAMTLAITVLVIACPHALGLAIPTVSTIATRLALKNGVFVKDMGKLEVVKKADYVVFDKTGTLTKGAPELANFEFMDNLDNVFKDLKWKTPRGVGPKDYIRSIVLSIELQSSHPVAAAVVAKLKAKKGTKQLEVKGFKNVAGRGAEASVDGHKVLVGTQGYVISGKTMLCANLDPLTQSWAKAGQTVVYVSIDNKHMASFSVADAVREESKNAIDDLHTLGLKVAMLTGDNKSVAESVAGKLNIDTYFAEVLPEDKYKHIKKLQDEGNVVLMVGDGVNDAPALTQANVGVAVGAGTDVAVEAGDVVLTDSSPKDIVSLVVLSRKVYKKMIENLVWALGYNVLAIPAAAGLFIPFGLRLTPEVGALLMSASSAIVVANAITLRSAKLDI